MDVIPQCEWNPGSNRSVVSIATAAKGISEADRALLISKFEARQYDDRIRIHRDRVLSETKDYRYHSVIGNMNFGNNNRCKVVTRVKWKDDHEESAMVFIVNGHYYGYAATCGNLFELEGELIEYPRLPPVEVPSEPTFDTPIPIIPPIGIPSPIPGDRELPSPGPGGFSTFVFGGFGGSSTFYGGGVSFCETCCFLPTTPTPPVPEPSTWLLFGAGLALVTRKFWTKS